MLFFFKYNVLINECVKYYTYYFITYFALITTQSYISKTSSSPQSQTTGTKRCLSSFVAHI